MILRILSFLLALSCQQLSFACRANFPETFPSFTIGLLAKIESASGPKKVLAITDYLGSHKDLATQLGKKGKVLELLWGGEMEFAFTIDSTTDSLQQILKRYNETTGFVHDLMESGTSPIPIQNSIVEAESFLKAANYGFETAKSLLIPYDKGNPHLFSFLNGIKRRPKQSLRHEISGLVNTLWGDIQDIEDLFKTAEGKLTDEVLAEMKKAWSDSMSSATVSGLVDVLERGGDPKVIPNDRVFDSLKEWIVQSNSTQELMLNYLKGSPVLKKDVEIFVHTFSRALHSIPHEVAFYGL